MPDTVVISGDVASRPVSPPPTIEVELPPPTAPAEQLPNEGEENIVLRRIEGEPIHMDDQGEALRKEIRARKEPDLVEWKAPLLPIPGPSASHDKQLRRASSAMLESRLRAMGKDLAEYPGVTAEAGRAAAEIIATAPPLKVMPVADAGPDGLPEYRIEALRDDQPIRAVEGLRNSNEAKRAVKNFRDLQDRQREQLLQDLQAAEQAEQQQLQATEAAAKAEQERLVAQQRANEAAAQRRAIEAERQRQLAQWQQQASEAEKAAAVELQQLDRWSRQAPPEERQAYWADAQQRYIELASHLQERSQVRAAVQTNAAQAHQRNVAVWAAQ